MGGGGACVEGQGGADPNAEADDRPHLREEDRGGPGDDDGDDDDDGDGDDGDGDDGDGDDGGDDDGDDVDDDDGCTTH